MVDGGYAKDPVVVAEVLSPSTMRWDRGGKVDFYQTIPSLRTILLVYQDGLRIEIWRREGAGWRKAVRHGRSAEFALEPFGDVIRLVEIYADVPIED